MLESGLSGSVRGVLSNGHPYRDPRAKSALDLLAVDECEAFYHESVPRPLGL